MKQDMAPAPEDGWLTEALRAADVGTPPDSNALIAAAIRRAAPLRRRRRVQASVATAVAASLLGAVGLATIPGLAAGPLVAAPAAPPALPSASRSSNVWEPDGEVKIGSRVAALYLARLSGQAPTRYHGVKGELSVTAQLSFGGPERPLDPQAADPDAPEGVDASDLSVIVSSPRTWDDPVTGPRSVFTCSGRLLSECHLDEREDGTALLRGVRQGAGVPVRGDVINVAQFLRADGSVVLVEGRSDVFSPADVVRISSSPLWEITRPASDEDWLTAEGLSPWVP